MTKIAIWCRHKGDNLIGIGANIPWHIPSDFKRFRKMTEECTLVAGEKTYESFPGRTLPNRDIYVLTLNPKYEVSDKKRHFVVNDINEFKDVEDDLYIAGGASVYKLFMEGGNKLMPDIVVDSVYHGEPDKNLEGTRIDITPCINVLEKKYRKITEDFVQDNVHTAIYVKAGGFVDQAVLKRLLRILEECTYGGNSQNEG